MVQAGLRYIGDILRGRKSLDFTIQKEGVSSQGIACNNNNNFSRKFADLITFLYFFLLVPHINSVNNISVLFSESGFFLSKNQKAYKFTIRFENDSFKYSLNLSISFLFLQILGNIYTQKW